MNGEAVSAIAVDSSRIIDVSLSLSCQPSLGRIIDRLAQPRY
jgi:hypothetical protein